VSQDAELPSKITDLTNTQTCGLCHDKKSEPESVVDKPGIEQEINHHPIAPANDDSQNKWQMPTTINLNFSGLSHVTTMTNQNAHLCSASPQIVHLHSASPQSFTSARVPSSTICPFGGLLCMVQSLAVKVPVTSSKELPAGFGLHLANSILSASLDLHSTSITNLSASLGLCTAKAETKAITEMIATTSKSNNALPFGGKSNKSFDNKSSSTFQLVVASVDWISNVISAHAKCPSSHESSCASLLALHVKCLNSHESSCASQILACANCLNKSNVFTFRLLIVGFIQQYQSQSQQDLVDLSLSNAFLIAKLDSINIKAKANSAMLIDIPTSQ
jgi:hypothetical protein